MSEAHDLIDDLSSIAQELLATYERQVDRIPLAARFPDREKVVALIEPLRALLFPAHAGSPREEGREQTSLVERLGAIHWALTEQIHATIPHDCAGARDAGCAAFRDSSHEASHFLRTLPALREMLALDVQAAYDGDPAAKSLDEIILAYPGLYAVMVYRIAHQLHRQGIRLIPRIMTEYAHSITGIDIHPGARIGRSFFIDHGTGVVVGETCEIGNNVKLYQGVTLGALSFPKDEMGQVIRDQKRHPTIEDDVVIYSGATILGGNTVIGRGAVIGGNVWLTESVPPGSKVLNRPQIEMRSRA